MSDKLLDLEVITPERIVISKKVKSVTVPGEKGSFQVLYNHTILLSNITIGAVKIRNVDDSEEFFATSGGFVSVEDNKVQILAEQVEHASEIDKKRAEESLQRAEELLKSSANEIDLANAMIAYSKAKNRLKIAAEAEKISK